METPTGQQANEALSKETLQCPDLAAMGAQRGRATLGKPAPDGTLHRRAERRHVAQSMAVQGMSYMGQIGPIVGRTPAPSTSIGPFRGDWIDRGTQVWVPKVIPGMHRCCLHPSLSAKRKKAWTTQIITGYFIWSNFYWRPSENPAPQCSQWQDPRCLH